MKLRKIYDKLLSESIQLFNEISAQDPCDCCKYFDWTFSKAGGYYAGLTNPIYYELQKSERHELKFISPEKYMREIARGFGMSYDEAMKSNVINWDAVKQYAEAMKNGAKFPIGFYKRDGNQEGRHRALALMSLGCNEMPVVLMSDVGYNEKKHIAEELRGLSREEVDQIYKDKGYDGISDLDWRDLQRFIEYNL